MSKKAELPANEQRPEWLEDGGFWTCLTCETSFDKPTLHDCHPCEEAQASANAEHPAEVICFTFPWTVVLSVDEDGYTIARFTDAPPNIHLSAHGSTAHEALTILTEIVKTWREMEAEEAAERPAPEAEPKHYRLQLEMAAKGCVSGEATEWPSLINSIGWALAHIDRLTARVKELEHALKYEPDGQLRAYLSNDALLSILDLAREYKSERDRLTAENAELRKDKARLDWLDHQIREGFKRGLVTSFESIGDPDKTTLREAIDTALAGGKP